MNILKVKEARTHSAIGLKEGWTNLVESGALSQQCLVYISISIMGIIGPIAEEIMFRLILVDKLRNRIPWVIPVIISGVLFGAYHMHVLNVSEFVSCLSHVMSGVVLAIIMVIDDHMSSRIGFLSSIFPYNSFYMPLFVFISGSMWEGRTPAAGGRSQACPAAWKR